MIALFAAAMFASALLLFWVQPMLTKAILPLLGGTPAVWNTALVFFQAGLLAGYLYAHLSSRWLGDRGQPLLHLLLLGAAALVLPIGLPEGWRPPAEGTPVFWLLGALAVALGAPFVVLSATAPLLQRWLATTDHADADDPYFLYAASNLGSMAALLGYPFLLEPLIGLNEQRAVWSVGYGAVAILIIASAWTVRRRPERPGSTMPLATTPPPDWRSKARWTLLAFAPSSLLIGVTTHVTTNVAAAPLLWVVPLALYLLTFVTVFSRRPVLRHSWMVRSMPYFAIVMAILLCLSVSAHLPLPFLFLHLGAFFVLAMVCHGDLARTRPAAAHLTGFYLWIALGGVLGGAFTALVAPLVFDSVVEYPLALVLAIALAPVAAGKRRFLLGDLLWPAGLLALSAIVLLVLREDLSSAALTGYLFLACIAIFAFRRRPVRLALGIGALIAAFSAFLQDETVLAQQRSFFGVNTVMADAEGRFHVFRHGTTVHGAQRIDREGRPEPISYYVREGPVGDVFRQLANGDAVDSAAVIGLGAGNIACYRDDGEIWTFYEIDPLVDQLARNPDYFTYLSECAPRSPVVFGDGRLAIQGAGEGAYDLIVLDAFSSDAVPVHLMTREALDLYLEKLAANGLLLVNISNAYVRLRPVVAALAADRALAGRARLFVPDRPEEARREYRLPSEWVVLARNEERLSGLDGLPGWEALDPDGGPLWTDDFSNLVAVLKWRF